MRLSLTLASIALGIASGVVSGLVPELVDAEQRNLELGVLGVELGLHVVEAPKLGAAVASCRVGEVPGR